MGKIELKEHLGFLDAMEFAELEDVMMSYAGWMLFQSNALNDSLGP